MKSEEKPNTEDELTAYRGWAKLSVRAETRVRMRRIKRLISRDEGKQIEKITDDEALQWILDKLNGVGIHV